MEKIPTAEEFLKGDSNNEPWSGTQEQALVEFAKLHVKAALKAASENAEAYHEANDDGDYETWVDVESILSAYPESNIK